MTLKFVADDGCQIINESSNVLMEKVEIEDLPEYSYALCFMNDEAPFAINILCKSYGAANEYLNELYENGKIDFSSNPDIRVTMTDMSDAIEDIMDLIDEDAYEDEDDD